MVEDFWEGFRRMEATGEADGLGGQAEALAEKESFRAGLCPERMQSALQGVAAAAQERYQLVHEAGVTLAPGEIIRRESDGALYRVAGHSDYARAPRRGRLAICQVRVERLVMGCAG